MARLTDEEFSAWCQRNQLSLETAVYIQRISQRKNRHSLMPRNALTCGERALNPGREVVFMLGLECSSSSRGPCEAETLARTTRWETDP
jgi:hypothetical protein